VVLCFLHSHQPALQEKQSLNIGDELSECIKLQLQIFDRKCLTFTDAEKVLQEIKLIFQSYRGLFFKNSFEFLSELRRIGISFH